MKIDESAFNDVVNLQGVKGLVLVSLDGRIIFKHFKAASAQQIEAWDWNNFLGSIDGMREVDLAFENGHLYLRRTPSGYLAVVAGSDVQIALLRLNCDILLPALIQRQGSSGGIKRFFKK